MLLIALPLAAATVGYLLLGLVGAILLGAVVLLIAARRRPAGAQADAEQKPSSGTPTPAASTP